MVSKKSSLKRYRIDGWTLYLREPEGFRKWVPIRSELMKKYTIKRNSLRTVFTVPKEHAGHKLYVKLEKARGFLKAVKCFCKSKAEKEFMAAELLEEKNIASVKYAGWGRRLSENMVISEEYEGAENARSYWFENHDSNERRIKFLHSLAQYIYKFMQSSLQHPDFHIGNLLYHEEKNIFIMVDVYGVTPLRSASDDAIFNMRRIIGAFRGEISIDEAISLIIESKMEKTQEAALKLWEKIVAAENDEMEKLWPKRREQILSGKSKYCVKSTHGGKEYFIRYSMSGKPLLCNSDIEFKGFEKLPSSGALSRDKSEKIWLDSFRKEFARIPQAEIPVLWEKSDDGASDRIFMLSGKK